MVPQILGSVTMLGTGTLAGVFFAVAVSVLPTLFALEPEKYVVTHQLLGKGYHPYMPLIATVALLSDVALVFVAPGVAPRVLFAASAVLLVGVQVVSQFGNVPINRVVGRMRPGALGADWEDPRPRWRRWHLLRTACAFGALLLTSVAGVLLP
ncbi:anthrone oxygenase family protein [Streptomyces acidicola]|uniref:anthrone oxygenase family protein n=1 Tax=Streptomyces acidicola TaxID=2596892 RepID=UPI0038068A42